jgi:heat shock protein HtpX
MQFIKRISLFILTNILIMVTIGIIWSLISTFFGLGQMNSGVISLMVLCLVMGMTGSFISLLLSRWMAKTMYGVKVLDPDNKTLPEETRWLIETVHTLARKAELPKMPEVGMYDSPDVNAFATGPSKARSLVAVSTGLFRNMSRPEIEGVLGHEITHIANGDMVTMTLIQGVVNSIAFFFSRLLAHLISSNVDERMRGTVRFAMTILGDILFTLLGSIVVAYFSRRREFRADAGSAKLASKANMVAALRRLQSVYALPLENSGEQRDAMATLKISHRDKPGFLMSLMMTHPPLPERIAALEKNLGQGL